MKKFLCYMTRQKELIPVAYTDADNQRLHYGELDQAPRKTAFPILPVINGYAEAGEEIDILVFTEEYENSERNYETFVAEAMALCAEKGIHLRNGQVTKILIPFDDGIGAQLTAFQKIIDRIEDGDELHACITYSSKPAVIVELMALRYARQIKKDTYIACVVYGGLDFIDRSKPYIYDVTALAQLDDILRMLGQSGDKNPKETLQKILSI